MSLSSAVHTYSQATLVTDRPPIARKHSSRSRWALATAATTLFVVSAYPISAFQSSAPLHRHKRTNHRRSTRQWTLTDPDILLREKVSRVSIDMAALEKAYSSSLHIHEQRPFLDDNNAIIALPERKRKKATAAATNTTTAATNTAATNTTTKNKSTSSRRSSTMPGFASRNTSAAQKAFGDGIKIVEQRSGKKYTDTPEARKQRRKQSNEAMYKTTASVPDSLVHFANEIHLVRTVIPRYLGWVGGMEGDNIVCCPCVR